MKKNIYKYLAGNDYPGRGIVLGKSPDGQKAVSYTHLTLPTTPYV